MPTTETIDTPAKPKDTWVDWLDGQPEPPADQLLTREQVLEFLQNWRVSATARDLKYWEGVGALPRAVVRWHRGATRATYPPWFPDLVKRLRQIQEHEGLALEEIGPRLRADVHAGVVPVIRSLSGRASATSNASGRPSFSRPGDQSAEDHGRIGATDRAEVKVLAMRPEDLALEPGLVAELQRLAERWGELSGVPAAHLEVRIAGPSGRATRYPVSLP